MLTAAEAAICFVLIDHNTACYTYFCSWVPASSTQLRTGLLVRSQNCSAAVNGTCVHCSGSGEYASVITFAEALVDTIDGVTLANITSSSVVFGPGNGTFDNYGTEDPRLALDPATGTYYMFYTSYGSGNGAFNSVLLSVASTTDPTSATGWTRHGAVFPEVLGSKSAALLIRQTGPHFLLWGDTVIRITNSTDPAVWPDIGEVLLAPRPNSFDSQLVESGPPPLLLSTGDYLFLHNSAGPDGYHPSWAILSGADPSIVLARADEPLLSPTLPWEEGIAPYVDTCECCLQGLFICMFLSL